MKPGVNCFPAGPYQYFSYPKTESARGASNASLCVSRPPYVKNSPSFAKSAPS